MKYTVSVLKSVRDGRHYIGYTNNLQRRIKEYNEGKTKSTKWRRPFELVYSESFSDKEQAEARENFLKAVKEEKNLKK